jgi:3-oxoacyl-[acyl-carrier protein] reductase
VGNGIARRFHAEGAVVVISDANEGRVRKVARELGVDGEVVDVGDAGAIRDHLGAVIDRHGRIDILVNAAGINVLAPAWELPEVEWRRIIDVNLTAPFLAARFILPAMIERGQGSIINISSIAAWLPTKGEIAYQTTKAGLVALTRGLALETAGSGVRVNAIAPGLVENRFLEKVYGAERVAALRRAVPFGRGADPAEIGAAALWLASDESSYVTGECLSVAGGWYFRP